MLHTLSAHPHSSEYIEASEKKIWDATENGYGLCFNCCILCFVIGWCSIFAFFVLRATLLFEKSWNLLRSYDILDCATTVAMANGVAKNGIKWNKIKQKATEYIIYTVQCT